MNAGGAERPGDRARVSVLVRVERAEAFRIFTGEIDLWWGRGPRYRRLGRGRGLVRLEPGVGGRILESFAGEDGEVVAETGKVTRWEPPARLAFEWRAASFAPEEATLVDVLFEEAPGGTLVTVEHRGWSGIRPDHPARHGLEPAAFLRMMGLWWSELLTGLRLHAARSAPRGRRR